MRKPSYGTIARRPLAQRDIDGLWDMLADEQGEDIADKFLHKVYRRLEALADYPLMGRERDDIRPGLRSSPVGRYVIFFYPLHDGIVVSRVLYGGRDIPSVYDEEEVD